MCLEIIHGNQGNHLTAVFRINLLWGREGASVVARSEEHKRLWQQSFGWVGVEGRAVEDAIAVVDAGLDEDLDQGSTGRREDGECSPGEWISPVLVRWLTCCWWRWLQGFSSSRWSQDEDQWGSGWIVHSVVWGSWMVTVWQNGGRSGGERFSWVV